MNDRNGLYLPGVPGSQASRPADSGIILPARPARTRRAVLGSALGLLGVAATGCSRPAHTFDPASETLPPDADAATPLATNEPPQTLATAAADFFGKGFVPEQRAAFGLDRAQILPSDNPHFPRMVRVSLSTDTINTENSVYHDGDTYGGTQLFLAREDEPTEELYLRYYLRFPEKFDFNKGGKLPGFFGVLYKPASKERTNDYQDGYASRFAWRKGSEGLIYSNTARPDNPITMVGKKKWTWELGKWICVEHGVRMSSDKFSQELLTVWINNQEVHKEHRYNPRISDRLRIGGIMFSVVYGGGDRSFAPETDTSIDLAGFAIGPQRVGPLPDLPG
ncbi:polysaccharide lyase [Candidatus Protofrankia californiensis]|uniref:polysaccharide lyase n=1 Tax=Candidatus Protofrankia californiensis TaxID=1839754 RepID=UPI00104135E7|nr:hypothetical protein [Candidatus Protofrankia californiensis]